MRPTPLGTVTGVVRGIRAAVRARPGVFALNLTGVSSGTLPLLAQVSRVATAVVLGAMTAGVAWLGWLTSRGSPRA